MRTLFFAAWLVVCSLAIIVAYGEGTSLELGSTSPLGVVTPVEATITPAQIGTLEEALHDTQFAYLEQRGWFHTADAPGGQWLWRKAIDGKEYAMATDDALNIEYELQHRAEEAALQAGATQ